MYLGCPARHAIMASTSGRGSQPANAQLVQSRRAQPLRTLRMQQYGPGGCIEGVPGRTAMPAGCQLLPPALPPTTRPLINRPSGLCVVAGLPAAGAAAELSSQSVQAASAAFKAQPQQQQRRRRAARLVEVHAAAGGASPQPSAPLQPNLAQRWRSMNYIWRERRRAAAAAFVALPPVAAALAAWAALQRALAPLAAALGRLGRWWEGVREEYNDFIAGGCGWLGGWVLAAAPGWGWLGGTGAMEAPSVATRSPTSLVGCQALVPGRLPAPQASLPTYPPAVLPANPLAALPPLPPSQAAMPPLHPPMPCRRDQAAVAVGAPECQGDGVVEQGACVHLL